MEEMTEEQKEIVGEAPKVEGVTEVPSEGRQGASETRKAEPLVGPSFSDKMKWGFAIAGVAGAALAFYFRNQITDGVKKLMGQETELEQKQKLIQDVAIEAPSEFLSPDQRAEVDIVNGPDVEYDTVHTPMSADDEAILVAMLKESKKESDHTEGFD